ncbi:MULTISPECIES: DUF5753 domain-containing protein [Actinoalloteichus]|uniref:DUF5753 domain-containing protein n=1 Tax=Actinoalloteichus TaxID=65496 RepID=UPI001E34D398|nr:MULTISPECIES: DUF5753 domain-containing protein [Actinoalloteichus]
MLALVRDVGRSAWSAVGHAVPAQLSTLVRYEREAVAITEVNAVLIPGLLQTENYVRAVMSTGDIPDDGIEDRVIYRMGRQSVLRRRAGAMTAIIDEGALTRQIGGHAVMAEQMTALLDWSNTGHVEVLIIPTSIGAHRGMAGGFMILDMPDGVVVHLEHLDSGVFLHEPADTRSFVEAASSLQDVAMSPVDSARLIATYADSHARNEASP